MDSVFKGGPRGRLFLSLPFPARLSSGLCILGRPLFLTCRSFWNEYSLGPFAPSSPKQLPLRSPVTSWLPDPAELDLYFLLLIFHGFSDHMELTNPSSQNNVLSCAFLILGSASLSVRVSKASSVLILDGLFSHLMSLEVLICCESKIC